MTQFEFIFVLVSIVLGLGLANLFGGISRQLQQSWREIEGVYLAISKFMRRFNLIELSRGSITLLLLSAKEIDQPNHSKSPATLGFLIPVLPGCHAMSVAHPS